MWRVRGYRAGSAQYNKDVEEFASAIDLKYAMSEQGVTDEQQLKDLQYKKGIEQIDIEIAANQTRLEQGYIDEQDYTTKLNQLQADRLDKENEYNIQSVENYRKAQEEKVGYYSAYASTVSDLTTNLFDFLNNIADGNSKKELKRRKL